MNLTTGLSNLTEQQKVRKAPTVARAVDNAAQPAQPTTAALLQRQVGNQALGRLGHLPTGDPAHARAVLQRLVAGPLQTKLTLGPVGDPYEQEADRVAKAVMGQINAPAPQPAALQRQDGLDEELQMKPQVRALQRQDLPEEDELMMKPALERLQRQDLPDEEELMMKPTLQRSDLLEGGPVGDDIESAIQRARGGGAGLPDGVRGSMESAFGADFSGVRVHTGSAAHDLNQSLQARAFTTGQDIFFRQGDYNPGHSAGQELLAHELTHVVQQNGPAVQREEQ